MALRPQIMLMLALVLLLVGCRPCGVLVKRESEMSCPTDIRQTVPWCAGEDAIFHCPCGPEASFYGYKPTCWSAWPASGAQWRDQGCGPQVFEGGYQVIGGSPSTGPYLEPTPLEGFGPGAPSAAAGRLEYDTQGIMPGGQFPSEQFPSQQFPGEQLPGEQLPGEQLPGEQLPGEQFPWKQFPGESLNSQQAPGGSISEHWPTTAVSPQRLLPVNRPTGLETGPPTEEKTRESSPWNGSASSVEEAPMLPGRLVVFQRDSPEVF